MDTKETIAMLTWINQVDPRVMLNESAVELWAYALDTTPVDIAKQAVLEHYKSHETFQATPGSISKRATNIRSSREARQKALEAPATTHKHPSSFRARNPQAWDHLFEQGRQARREELTAKGLL